MAYTTINKGSSYFNTVLYTGNGTTQSITGVGFKPDWVWLKSRNNTYYHNLYDAVRGFSSVYGRVLFTNDTLAEDANAGLTSFNTDGFSLGSEVGQNGNATTYVAWNWLGANTTVSNTSGTISSTVSANTTAGFSIVSYTGNGSNGATIGHGLGVSPKMVIVKSRSNTGDWAVYHASLTAGNMVFLNTTGASGTISGFDNGGINPVSSTTFTTAQGGVSQNNVNTSGRTYIAYCFAEIRGYSKFASYTGNGSTDGPFIYTGFTPAFIMCKKYSSTGAWVIQDNKRAYSFNVHAADLNPNYSEAEESNGSVDLLSNGFKMRNTDGDNNASGQTYIYMAFAENPFVTSGGIPTTAR
ncbi:MAG: hypothetical protein EBR82_30665 [Caulobacteraceae bacterium]|nr:hypothetical protein [Caulobacteraceae bacterium]